MCTLSVKNWTLDSLLNSFFLIIVRGGFLFTFFIWISWYQITCNEIFNKVVFHEKVSKKYFITFSRLKAMISIFKPKKRTFKGLPRMSSCTYIKLPPYLLRSHLKVLNLFKWNWIFGEVTSNLDSELRNLLKLLAALLRLCLFSCQFKMVKLLMNSLIFFITMTYHMSWSAMYLNLDVFESLCLYNW